MGGAPRAQAGGGARCLFGKLAMVARASDADAADGLSLSFSLPSANKRLLSFFSSLAAPSLRTLSLSNPRKPRGKQES